MINTTATTPEMQAKAMLSEWTALVIDTGQFSDDKVGWHAMAVGGRCDSGNVDSLESSTLQSHNAPPNPRQEECQGRLPKKHSSGSFAESLATFSRISTPWTFLPLPLLLDFALIIPLLTFSSTICCSQMQDQVRIPGYDCTRSYEQFNSKRKMKDERKVEFNHVF